MCVRVFTLMLILFWKKIYVCRTITPLCLPKSPLALPWPIARPPCTTSLRKRFDLLIASDGRFFVLLIIYCFRRTLTRLSARRLRRT